MFGIDSAELLIVAIVALVVIGPKDLPKVMRTVGEWVGRARGMAKHFRTGIDTMIRESELEEMEKKWKADNERIMREHPAVPGEDAAAPAAPTPVMCRPSRTGRLRDAAFAAAERHRPRSAAGAAAPRRAAAAAPHRAAASQARPAVSAA
jgi:sec-independent protein translocase protein TatB